MPDPVRTDHHASQPLRDRLLTSQELAKYLGLTVNSVFNAVAAGRLPKPTYPVPRSPRWRLSEVDAMLEATRAMPRDAREQRRAKRLAQAQVA